MILKKITLDQKNKKVYLILLFLNIRIDRASAWQILANYFNHNIIYLELADLNGD
jgi:hypothetical protein